MNSSSITGTFAAFFERDLAAFIRELRSVPDDRLWTAPDGVKNPAGVLGQHVAGNIHHFIGHGLGGNSYRRQRDLEFTNTGRTKEEIAADLESAGRIVADLLPRLSDEILAGPFPLEIPFELNTLGMIIQIHHHLSYHLGQLNYLRRVLAG